MRPIKKGKGSDHTWVDDVVDSVDGQASFCDVGGDDDLARARRRRIENPGLHFRRKSRVDREDDQLGNFRTEALHPLVEDLAGRVDLLLTWRAK